MSEIASVASGGTEGVSIQLPAHYILHTNDCHKLGNQYCDCRKEEPSPSLLVPIFGCITFQRLVLIAVARLGVYVLKLVEDGNAVTKYEKRSQMIFMVIFVACFDATQYGIYYEFCDLVFKLPSTCRFPSNLQNIRTFTNSENEAATTTIKEWL